MRRREFVAGLGAAALALPRVARAQTTESPVIGVLERLDRQSVGAAAGRVPQWPGRSRLCGGPDRDGRLSLGKRTI